MKHMKTHRRWRSAVLLPVFGLCTLSMTSCMEKEIIELQDEDLVIQEGDKITADLFDISNPTGRVYNEEGEHVGYLDEQFRTVGLDGNYRSMSPKQGNLLGKDDEDIYNVDHVFTLYHYSSFIQDIWPYFKTNGLTSTYSIDIPDVRVESPIYPGARSIALRPGCSATLYPGQYYTGTPDYITANDPIRYRSTSWNINSMKITCTNGTKREFCGYAYREPGYQDTKLPYYTGSDINFDNTPGADFSWWRNHVRSISHDRGNVANCPGVMVYDNSADPYSAHFEHILNDDIDLGNNTIGNDGVSRIETSRELKRSTSNINTSNNVGAVLYQGTNFSGNYQLLEANGTVLSTYIVDEALYGQLGSYVVSPNCKLRLSNDSDFNTTLTEDNRNNSTGLLTVSNAGTKYFNSSSSRVSTSTIVEIVCNNTEARFAGLAFTNINYSGNAFPLYEGIEFSPQQTPGFTTSRVKSIQLNDNSIADFLVVDKANDEFHWRLLPISKDFSDITSWADTDQDLVKFTPLDAIGAHNAENLVSLSEKDWDGLIAYLDGFESQSKIQMSESQRDQFCRIAVNKCRTSFSELEHKANWDEFWGQMASAQIGITTAGLMAYAYKVYQSLGAKAATSYVRMYESLGSQSTLSEGSMYDAFMSGITNQANGIVNVTQGQLNLDANDLRTIADAHDLGEEGQGIEMTLSEFQGTVDAGNGAEEIALVITQDGNAILTGPALETLTIETGAEIAGLAGSAAGEGIVAVEAAEVITAGTVATVMIGVAAIGVGIYYAVKLLDKKDKLSEHEPCDDWNKACLGAGGYGPIVIVP